MARVFNSNDFAASIKIGGATVSLGAREGWEGALSASDAAEVRKIDGIEVTGDVVAPKAKRKR